MKTCKRCEKSKKLTEYSKALSNKDRLNTRCKKCIAELTMIYFRSLYGKITAIYNNQKSLSIQRKHAPPSYTKKELEHWMNQNGYKVLWETWKNSKYKPELSPSVDRLNDLFPYTLNNIRLVTWKENNNKNHKERFSCHKITQQNKKINQLTISGDFIASFASIAFAARTLNICRTNINNVCLKKHHTAGGFKWEYA